MMVYVTETLYKAQLIGIIAKHVRFKRRSHQGCDRTISERGFADRDHLE
jgi:hypothetical protein